VHPVNAKVPWYHSITAAMTRPNPPAQTVTSASNVYVLGASAVPSVVSGGNAFSRMLGTPTAVSSAMSISSNPGSVNTHNISKSAPLAVMSGPSPMTTSRFSSIYRAPVTPTVHNANQSSSLMIGSVVQMHSPARKLVTQSHHGGTHPVTPRTLHPSIAPTSSVVVQHTTTTTLPTGSTTATGNSGGISSDVYGATNEGSGMTCNQVKAMFALLPRMKQDSLH